MNFAKMHGTGNDFVVVRPQNDDRDWQQLALAMCDRHFGIGSDGLILALPSVRADLRMRMFNPDGSEAEMCGNGIRCLAKFAVESGLTSPRHGAITIETVAGDLLCELRGSAGNVEHVRVAMGVPRLRPSEVPVRGSGQGLLRDLPVSVAAGTFPVTCVSMGNPHAVHFTDTPVSEFPLGTVGPQIEHSEIFPNRVNFEVVNNLGQGRVRARVWERGAGETLACGTGACAIGVAAHLAGRSDGKTLVSLTGGDLLIEWDGDGQVYLSGPATEVFRGEWMADRSGSGVGAATGTA
ncbi:MAG TPA: diaminopimelate epimerase [Dehalococcoidia bacterium]|nr:diaminopimelate epimerase [Dehalococcoidia bacterium]